MMVFLLPWMAFAGVFMLVALLGWLTVGRRSVPANGRNGRSIAPPPVLGPFTGFFAACVPTSQQGTASLDRDLRRAGWYRPSARFDYLAIRNVLIVGVALVTSAWIMATADRGPRITLKLIAAGIIGAVICYALPRLWLQWYANRRVQRIQVGLPDALDIITMCLTGGLPLQGALQRVNGQLHRVHPDLAHELDILRCQTEAGSLEHALRQFANRIDAPEVQTLTTLVGHAERLGTNVSSAIREYADGIRRSHRQRAEERGNKLTIHMLFPIALCLAPAAYIMLLGPPVMEIRDFLRRENRPGGVLAPTDLSIMPQFRNAAPPPPSIIVPPERR